MENIDYLAECGYRVPIVKVTLADKSKIVHAVSLHFTFLKAKPVIDQLKEGLEYNSGSLMKFVQENSAHFVPFFHGVSAEPPSAGKVACIHVIRLNI